MNNDKQEARDFVVTTSKRNKKVFLEYGFADINNAYHITLHINGNEITRLHSILGNIKNEIGYFKYIISEEI